MKEYKKPKMKIVEIKSEDIIRTSGEASNDGKTITGGTVEFKEEWKTSSASAFE